MAAESLLACQGLRPQAPAAATSSVTLSPGEQQPFGGDSGDGHSPHFRCAASGIA